MLFNSYGYEILYEQFHWIHLQGDIKLLLVTQADSEAVASHAITVDYYSPDEIGEF